MLADVEPVHSYIREPAASVLHHVDYLNHRDDHALCGVAVENPITQTEFSAADICPDCEAKLTVYHLEWWREKAITATAELEVLRVKYRELAQSADTESPHVATAEPEQDQVGSAAESAPTEATTFLERARRELAELCRKFDGAVPFFRLKNTMQEFSDKLDDHERVLLAQEIGSDGSLIRWATTEVEGLGLSVTNNRVQENTDMMWEEWLQESQQAPKTKRRFGRSK
jgi:Zn ribbon nucleic-acid-binding protein